MSAAAAVAERNGSQNGTSLMAPGRPPVVAGKTGLELRNIEDMWRFAQFVAKSGLAPKGIETAEAILVAIQMGAEVGLTPMASLQNIAVINGRPSLWGDAMLAVCRASGVFDEKVFEEIVSPDRASCTVCRIGGKPITRTFTMDEAKKAGLATKSGPWQQYPQRMLQMRARSFALRDGFSDYLRGIRSIEEERDIRDGAMVTDAQIVDEPRPRKLDDLTAKLNGKKTDGLPDDRVAARGRRPGVESESRSVDRGPRRTTRMVRRPGVNQDREVSVRNLETGST